MSEIIFNSPQPKESTMQSQIDSFQTTLASLNQQVIILQETLQERDQEIAELELRLVQQSNQIVVSASDDSNPSVKINETPGIVGIIIDLLRFIFWPKRDASAQKF